MLLSHSHRKDYAPTSLNTGSHIRSESMKNKSDLTELDPGSTADLKMVISTKKIDHSLFYWMIIICFLMMLFGSGVFIFFTKGSGNKRFLAESKILRLLGFYNNELFDI